MSSHPLPLSARLTALGRTVDVRLPSNRFAVVATVATFAVSAGARLAWSDAGTADAALAGAIDGVAVFLAWALGRDLDPDRTSAARYAVFAAVPLLLLGPPALGPLVAVLAAVRLMLRPKGLPPRPLDLVGVVVISVWSATSQAGLVPALALVVSAAVDARLDERRDPRPAYVAAGLALVATVPTTILAGDWWVWRAPWAAELAVIAVTAIVWLRLRTDPPWTRATRTGEPLDPARLLAARRTAGACLLAALLWSGGDAVGALGPVWGALVGTALAQHLAERAASTAGRG